LWRIDEEKKSLIQEPEKNFRSNQGMILSLAASGDGMIASGGSDGTIHLSGSPTEVSPILRDIQIRLTLLLLVPSRNNLLVPATTAQFVFGI
jgi:hypothetical protein